MDPKEDKLKRGGVNLRMTEWTEKGRVRRHWAFQKLGGGEEETSRPDVTEEKSRKKGHKTLHESQRVTIREDTESAEGSWFSSLDPGIPTPRGTKSYSKKGLVTESSPARSDRQMRVEQNVEYLMAMVQRLTVKMENIEKTMTMPQRLQAPPELENLSETSSVHLLQNYRKTVQLEELPKRCNKTLGEVVEETSHLRH